MLVRYARSSTDAQDLTAQRQALTGLGVKPNRIYVAHGLTRTNRARPRTACACAGDMPRRRHPRGHQAGPACAFPGRRPQRRRRADRGRRQTEHRRPAPRPDRAGQTTLFNVLGMVAEDLIRMRTREGMKIAKANGRLRGKQPKLKPAQEAHLIELWCAGSTPAPNRPNCSPSPAPPSTALPNGPANRRRREPVARERPHLPRRDQAPRLPARRQRHRARRPRPRSPDPARSGALAPNRWSQLILV